jgi:hypothetical protein
MQALFNSLSFSWFCCICCMQTCCKTCKSGEFLASLARRFSTTCHCYALSFRELAIACMSCMRFCTFFVFDSLQWLYFSMAYKLNIAIYNIIRCRLFLSIFSANFLKNMFDNISVNYQVFKVHLNYFSKKYSKKVCDLFGAY